MCGGRKFNDGICIFPFTSGDLKFYPISSIAYVATLVSGLLLCVSCGVMSTLLGERKSNLQFKFV